MGGNSALRRRALGIVIGATAMVGTGGWMAWASGSVLWPAPPGPLTTTTTASSTTTSITATAPSTTAARGPAAGTTTTTLGPGSIPPDLEAMIASVKRTPPSNTVALLKALQPLIDMGMTPQQAAMAGMGRFPVGGVASWSDDFLTPRFDGTFHLHQGNDIFAAAATPVRSPTDGTLRQSSDPLGGTVLFITQSDGTYFYLAHLSGYAPGEAPVQHVSTGQLVGFVGNTGDAAGGPTHLHFEVHPAGGAAVDPKPILDGWVRDAIAAVPQVEAQLFPAAIIARSGTADIRSFALTHDGGEFAAPAIPSQPELAWVAAANPAGGALQVAAAEAQVAAGAIDWTAQAQAGPIWEAAEQQARALLAPLMPPDLAAFDGIVPKG